MPDSTNGEMFVVNSGPERRPGSITQDLVLDRDNRCAHQVWVSNWRDPEEHCLGCGVYKSEVEEKTTSADIGLLVDWQIERLCRGATVRGGQEPPLVDPFTLDAVQPASIDVHLHHQVIQVGADGDRRMSIGDELEIRQGEFLLASTVETVYLPGDISARFEGKSTLGRLGLATHVTAGFIDPGFTGQITLEMWNVSPRPVTIRPGMRIGQVCFTRLGASSARPYGSPQLGSHYQGQVGPTPAATDKGEA